MVVDPQVAALQLVGGDHRSAVEPVRAPLELRDFCLKRNRKMVQSGTQSGTQHRSELDLTMDSLAEVQHG